MIQTRIFRWVTWVFMLMVSFHLQAQETLDLKKCIEIALEQNIAVRKAGLNTEKSGLNLQKSKASLLPNLNAYASQGYSFGNSLDYTTYEYVREKINSNYFQLNSEVTLFQGFSKINTVKANQYALEANIHSNQNMKDQIALQTAAAYLAILMNLENVAFMEEQIKLTKSMLEKTKILVEVGQETKAKELELNAELANNEYNLVEAQNKLEQSYLELKQLLNWDMKKPLSISKYAVDMMSLGNYENIDIESIINQYVSELPQMKQAKAELESAQYAYKAAKGLMYPALSLQGNLTTRYSSLKNPLTGQITPFSEQLDNNFGQYFTFGLSIPLFNNLNTYGNTQAARLNIRNAELNYRESEVKAKNNIYEAWFNLKNAINKYESAVKSQEAQKLLFEQSSVMYQEGVISYYEWQSARNGLTRAENTLLGAKYECVYRMKVFDYYRGIDISL